MKSNPLGSALGGKTFKQLAKTTMTIEVETVICGVLRDDDNFFNAGFYELFGFIDDAFDRA